MKTRYFSVLLIFIVALTACAGGQTEAADNTITRDYTSYEGLSALMESKEQGVDFFLIDVRTEGEYESGHIPEAMLIPVDTITENMPTEAKDALIILYCRSGARAGSALNALTNMGYTNVLNFGGVGKWKGELNTGEQP
jgi:phage shock protein E